MKFTRSYLDRLTYKVIGCAIEVHKQLGPGLLESIYEKCLVHELMAQGLSSKTQLNVPVHYKGAQMETDR